MDAAAQPAHTAAQELLPVARAAASLPLPAISPPAAPEQARLWITNAEFSHLAGIGERCGKKALRACYEGGAWRGHKLKVSSKPSTLGGGAAGLAYEVHVPSLPPGLAQKWYDRNKRALAAPKPPAAPAELATPEDLNLDRGRRLLKAKWKRDIIAPALVEVPRSPARGEMFRRIAAEWHDRPDGKRVRITETTLRTWAALYEKGGLEGLMPKQRGGRGKRRHLVNRTWDRLCPLSPEEKQRIAQELETHIRSLWASGVAGRRHAEQLASAKLLELSRAAGWDAGLEECRVRRHLIEMHAGGRIVAVMQKDAKRFFDHHIPRIRRHLDGLKPLDLVVGDVKILDEATTRPDGSLAYPRAICWLDAAPERMFVTLHLLGPREGIRQEHVAASFVAMVQEWGLPRRLLLDNGSEYSWAEMMDGFAALAGLVQDFQDFHAAIIESETVNECLSGGEALTESEGEKRPGLVVRSKPYSPPGKIIEGSLSVLGRILAMLPGHGGGDRMRPKTHRIGKKPRPHPGTWEEYQRDFFTALRYFHATAQHGRLKGKSPNQVLQGFIDAGFQKPRVPPEIFLLSFSEERHVMVRPTGIQVGGRGADGQKRWYYGDALLNHMGQRVRVCFAKWNPERVPLIRDGKPPVFLEQKTFGMLDPSGAKEQARREKALKAIVYGLKRGTTKLDLVKEMQGFVAASGPAPVAPDGPQVILSAAHQDFVETAQAAGDPKPIIHQLEAGETVNEETGDILPMSAFFARGTPEPAPAPLTIEEKMKFLRAPFDEEEQRRRNEDAERGLSADQRRAASLERYAQRQRKANP